MSRRPSHLALLLGAVIALLALASAPATAIPPDGAGADTPGTSAGVSERTLRAGEVIHFTVSGFPANEVVYVKIDDGKFCAKAGVHGACVVHQQRIPGNGRVTGSFVLPRDIKPGKHWLRFLASQELTDSSGNYLGIKGFTCRGKTDFSVVAGSASPSGGGTPATGGSATGSEAPATTGDATGDGATGDAAAGDTAAVRAVKAGGTLRVPAPPPSATTPEPSAPAPATETPEPVAAAPVRQAATTESDDTGFPVAGVVGLALLVAASAGLLLRAGRRRGA